MYLQDLEISVLLLSLCHDLKGKDLGKTIWDTSTGKKYTEINTHLINVNQIIGAIFFLPALMSVSEIF